MLRNWALALRPSLSLDFLAGLNDSRITYSGGANGTRVNSSGVIVAATTPRFDYNPVTLAAKGLLVEEARTNLFTRSEEFDDAAWTKQGSTISSNATTAPDGSSNADKLTEDTSTGFHRVYQTPSTPGSAQTLVFYAKASERSFVFVRMNDGGNVARNAWFNIASGALGSADAGYTTSISSAGGGWYRCSATLSGATSGAIASIAVSTADAVATYTGTSGSGAFIWGAQLEAGSFPTSYIPTTSASVTRTADSAVMTGTNFSSWYNQSEGTFVVAGDLAFPVSGGSQFLARASDNSYNNSVAANCSSTGFGATNTAAGGVFDGNASVTNIFVANTVFKMASSYAANNLACCVDGQTVATDATATIPSGLTRLDIGADHGGFNRIGSGHIRSITYYPSRLSNEQLPVLTS